MDAPYTAFTLAALCQVKEELLHHKKLHSQRKLGGFIGKKENAYAFVTLCLGKVNELFAAVLQEQYLLIVADADHFRHYHKGIASVFSEVVLPVKGVDVTVVCLFICIILHNGVVFCFVITAYRDKVLLQIV